MRNRLNYSAYLILFAAIGLVGAAPLCASIRGPTFEETTRSAFDRLFAPETGIMNQGAPRGMPLAEPKARAMDLSARILSADPEVGKELDHLRAGLQEAPGVEAFWEQYSLLESELFEALRRRGTPITPRIRNGLSLVGASMFWQQMQYDYDTQANGKRVLQVAGLIFHEPLEAELRGWQAGCKVWKAGVGSSLMPGMADAPDALNCREGFSEKRYCERYYSVELVVLAGYLLRSQDVSFGDVEASLDQPAAGQEGDFSDFVAQVLKGAFAGYCAEFERVRGGNPLSMAGVEPAWSPRRCLDNALETVLAPDWVGSTERCTDPLKTGADVPEAARILQDWK